MADDQDATFERWGRRSRVPNVIGLVVGRSLLYPPDDDVAAAVDAAVGLFPRGARRRERPARRRDRRRRTRWRSRPESAGWGFSGLRVLELAAGGDATLDTGEDELIVLPLDGRLHGDGGRRGVRARRARRASSPPSPTSSTRRATRACEIASERRRALRAALAPARPSGCEPRHVPAEDVPVELRGAGQASRQVNNFCSPGGLRRPTA